MQFIVSKNSESFGIIVYFGKGYVHNEWGETESALMNDTDRTVLTATKQGIIGILWRGLLRNRN